MPCETRRNKGPFLKHGNGALFFSKTAPDAAEAQERRVKQPQHTRAAQTAAETHTTGETEGEGDAADTKNATDAPLVCSTYVFFAFKAKKESVVVRVVGVWRREASKALRPRHRCVREWVKVGGKRWVNAGGNCLRGKRACRHHFPCARRLPRVAVYPRVVDARRTLLRQYYTRWNDSACGYHCAKSGAVEERLGGEERGRRRRRGGMALCGPPTRTMCSCCLFSFVWRLLRGGGRRLASVGEGAGRADAVSACGARCGRRGEARAVLAENGGLFWRRSRGGVLFLAMAALAPCCAEGAAWRGDDALCGSGRGRVWVGERRELNGRWGERGVRKKNRRWPPRVGLPLFCQAGAMGTVHALAEH